MHEKIDINQRDIRQRNQLPPEAIAKTRATVIGVGAVGRRIALCLASIGVRELVIIDDDTIGIENIANQGFYEDQIGQKKVAAIAAEAKRRDPRISLIDYEERFRHTMVGEIGLGEDGYHEVIFCCVDNIETRSDIFGIVKDKATLWVDTRMNAETARVFTVSNAASKAYYPTTIFTVAQAATGQCSVQSTCYTADIIAGLAVSQMAKFFRGIPIEKDITLNILSLDLVMNAGV